MRIPLSFGPTSNAVPHEDLAGFTPNPTMRYRFDEYVLDSDRRELRRGADSVAVEPKVFDLLLHLIRNRHRVVSKDELLAALWEGRIVSESALSTRTNAARAAAQGPAIHRRRVRRG